MKTFNVPIILESTKVVLTVESCCIARVGKERLTSCPYVSEHEKKPYCSESYGMSGDLKIAKGVLFDNAFTLTKSCPMVSDR